MASPGDWRSDRIRDIGLTMFTRIALLLILLVAVPYYWLLMDPGPTTVAPRTIDIARLRSLAESQQGPRPVGIEYAAVATDNEPGTLLVAGGGLRTDETAVFIWRLITPGGDTVINSGLTEDQSLATGYDGYHPEMQQTANGWLRSARRIIFTSEDIDHIGGLVSLVLADRKIAGKLIGNPRQIDALRALAPVLMDSLSPPPAALADPAGYAAIAPGIAVMRTPGYLDGTQMIYVRLQNGREFLFAGDTAPMRRNVTWQRPRSRYVAEWLGSEDRAATLGWIKGLASLKQREPGLTVVYGHDFGWLKDNAQQLHFAAAPAGPLPAPERKAAR
jgi:glyoxylase-like metal-dependent hydrolase (beta-lactamase superfamily II)